MPASSGSDDELEEQPHTQNEEGGASPRAGGAAAAAAAAGPSGAPTSGEVLTGELFCCACLRRKVELIRCCHLLWPCLKYACYFDLLPG